MSDITIADEINAKGQRVIYRDTRCLCMEMLLNASAHVEGKLEPYEIRHTEVKNVTPQENVRCPKPLT